MCESGPPPFGAVAWRDLTVDDAPAVRDFYAAVAGWTPVPVSMGEYDDYEMRDEAGNSVAGVCHARGLNADLPPQWLVYILVADLDAAADATRENGGEVVVAPRDMGGGRMAVVRDPIGAVSALFEPPTAAGGE
ncbi:VOC family protein [bacterium]|nr:VOC family protein [bacterium]